jgi:hypothetical protein
MTVASPRLGIKGTRSKRILLGKCVNTIVLTRPNLLATQPDASDDNPEGVKKRRGTT